MKNQGLRGFSTFVCRAESALDPLHTVTLAGIDHLLIRLRGRAFSSPSAGTFPFIYDAEQALWSAGVAALFQAVPKLRQAQFMIPAAHITNQLKLCCCMLVWVAVRPPRLASQGLHTFIPTGPPEVDARTAPVVLPAGMVTPYFSAYFIRDCLCAMSCVILLLMKDVASSRFC